MQVRRNVRCSWRSMIHQDKRGKNMTTKIIGLSELWDEITGYVGDLMDYAYIDDQIEINMIWDLVEEYKKKNNADNEPWNLKEKIINDIYFMFYDVYNSMPDPFDDLIEIICSSKEDKIRYAEILYTADDKYVKYEGAILLAELGCTEKVIDYFENYRGYEREKVYGLMLDYYIGSDYEKAVETANNALKNCRKDQTEFMIFLLKDAQKSGDEAKFKKLFRNAHVRKLVNSDVIDSMFEIDNDSDGGKSE